MDFGLTPEQELVRDTARALLARECPSSVLRAHCADPGPTDGLWKHLRDFTALGTGPLVDLCLFVEQTGYVAAPGPFFPTACLFSPLLSAVGSDAAAAAATGALTGTVAIAGATGSWVANHDPVKTFVLEADRVEQVAVVTPGRVSLVTRPPARWVETLDVTRRVFEVGTDGLEGPRADLPHDVLARVLERATVALAAEMVGTARRLLDLSVAYARERVQFGVPIGSFQAVQHTLADVSLDVERAWGAVYYAAMAADAGDDEQHRARHVAKAAAGEAARRAAKDAIQVHGGIGYTWEHDLHLFLRRAVASEYLLGTTGWHHDRLADLLI